MKRLLNILLVCLFIPLLASADYAAGRFFVVEKSLDFDKKILSGKCSGTIPYPVLSHDEEELFMKINRRIYDFAEIYVICNKKDRKNFSVVFDLPDSGNKDFFSVRWITKKEVSKKAVTKKNKKRITKKEKKIWRIDTLNFNFDNGTILVPDDIFNLLGNNMIARMVELSEGHLPSQSTWEDFLDKIEKRDVQLYIKNNEWYIVFNATPEIDNVIDIKIPKYFLIGNRDDDRG